ncbi:MFS transporter [Seohaeicola zhoushanensis]|uniref:MFS transporter n=1 Tax=Seohaeicola zhoushanensis TaxID=1569283 RepID=A0A8J3GVM1_9RHOB|nr:MFS transporter [Seohaeicola zhoushanensis]GHF41044.1 MFS transporter [Seohaeicola zhoushanensis]
MIALFSLALCVLSASLGVSIAAVALPAFAADFAVPMAGAQWVVLAYLLATTVASVLAGRLGDVLGRREVLLAGIALFAVASLAAALAPGFGALIAARAAQGVGAAVLMALPLSFVPDIVAPERTGRAMGLLGSVSAFGTALGPSAGGLVLAEFGWRAVFLVLVPLGVLAFALALRLPRETASRSGGLDLPGTLALGLTLAAYALATTLGAPWLLLPAALGLVAFLWIETHAAAPLLPPALLREPGLAAALAMSTLVATVMMSTLVVGPFYLTTGLGLGAATMGLVMAVGPATAALSGIPAGRVTDRLGPALTLRLGLLVSLGGTIALASLPPLLGTPGYILALMMLTPGFQLFFAANSTAVMAEVDPARKGLVSGLLNLSRNLGFITGAAVLGAVFAAASGPTPEAMATGLGATFGTAAALLLLALVLGAASRTRQRTV